MTWSRVPRKHVIPFDSLDYELMQYSEFGERQYETAVNNELAEGTATPFVPTPHVEFFLGIDAAHDPRSAHAIWRILSVSVPRRVRMSPGFWPHLPRRFHAEIPGRLVSLFVQYKVVKFQDGRRAKHHSRFAGPYYEATITSHQQRRLRELESRVGDRAVVR
jgi:hypothetical protein